jgi:hypothetical protein
MNRIALTVLYLSVLALVGCGAKESENQSAFNACSNTNDVLNLPFSYILTESDRILTPSYDAGDNNNIYVHFAPFGAHFNPMTGHAYGNNKIDFVGFFSENNLEIIDLGAGEFGWYADANASELFARRPMYYAPARTTITSISYVASTSGLYLDDEPVWNMTLNFGNIEIKLDHVGKLSPALHDFIMADPDVDGHGLNIDTDTYTGPVGDIFPSGYLITAASGTELAFPQVIASAVAGHPGYYNGAGSTYPDRPHVQIEFFVSAPTANGNNDVCGFELMSTSLQNTFQNILNNDLTNPDSQRYGDWQDSAWQWRAESSICLSCSTYSNDLNGLYKDLGGWFDRGDNSTIKDELIAFVPVEQNTASYDSTLYVHDVQTEWLMLRRRNDSQTWDWEMDDASIVSTDYPAGEIITVEDDSLLVLWRDLGQATAIDSYQWVRYDVTNNLVTLKFGLFNSDINNVLKPDFDIDIDLANDDDVVTFGKTRLAGF